jgi:hypothetical protein
MSARGGVAHPFTLFVKGWRWFCAGFSHARCRRSIGPFVHYYREHAYGRMPFLASTSVSYKPLDAIFIEQLKNPGIRAHSSGIRAAEEVPFVFLDRYVGSERSTAVSGFLFR